MKSFTISEMLPESAIEVAMVIGRDIGSADTSAIVGRLEREVVAPNMAEINRRTGQENDARYMAYAVYYALSQASRSAT